MENPENQNNYNQGYENSSRPDNGQGDNNNNYNDNNNQGGYDNRQQGYYEPRYDDRRDYYNDQRRYDDRPYYDNGPRYDDRPYYNDRPRYDDRPYYDNRPRYDDRQDYGYGYGPNGYNQNPYDSGNYERGNYREEEVQENQKKKGVLGGLFNKSKKQKRERVDDGTINGNGDLFRYVFDINKAKQYIDRNKSNLSEKEREEIKKREMANLKRKWPAVAGIVIAALLIGVLLFFVILRQ